MPKIPKQILVGLPCGFQHSFYIVLRFSSHNFSSSLFKAIMLAPVLIHSSDLWGNQGCCSYCLGVLCIFVCVFWFGWVCSLRVLFGLVWFFVVMIENAQKINISYCFIFVIFPISTRLRKKIDIKEKNKHNFWLYPKIKYSCRDYENFYCKYFVKYKIKSIWNRSVFLELQVMQTADYS